LSTPGLINFIRLVHLPDMTAERSGRSPSRWCWGGGGGAGAGGARKFSVPGLVPWNFPVRPSSPHTHSQPPPVTPTHPPPTPSIVVQARLACTAAEREKNYPPTMPVREKESTGPALMVRGQWPPLTALISGCGGGDVPAPQPAVAGED
jgi:hypothetical protein